MRSYFLCLLAVCFLCTTAFAGELELEDINFPYDSRIVVDDLKQLTPLAAMLSDNPQLYLEISAHADAVGSEGYNQELSLGRADNVKAKLIELGVAPARIQILPLGESAPKSDNSSVEGRFINRRAVFSIYALKNGQKEYYYKDNELIRPFEIAAAPAAAGASAGDMDDIKSRLDDLERRADQLATSDDVKAVGDKIDGIDRTLTQVEHQEMFAVKRGSLALGGGSYYEGAGGMAEGKFFLGANRHFGFQGGLVGDYSEKYKNYQADFGLVANHETLQLGAFMSGKWADFQDTADTGSVSQFSMLASLLFDNSSIGAYAALGMTSEDTVQTTFAYDPGVTITDTIMDVTNKFGLSYDWFREDTVALEARLGVTMAEDNDLSGKIKVGWPVRCISDDVIIFGQISLNQSLIDEDNNGVAAFLGVEIGNWFQRKTAAEDIRSMQVPTISYELKPDVRPVSETPR